MDQILLCTTQIPRTTLIYNSFIENYMPEANGDYVKVYLYLAKCIQHQESGLSINFLADRMDHTEKDVIRALQYWEKKKLLRIERDPQNGYITSIDMSLPEEPAECLQSDRMSAAPTAQAGHSLPASSSLPSGRLDFKDEVAVTDTLDSPGRYPANAQPETQTRTTTYHMDSLDSFVADHPETAATSFITAPMRDPLPAASETRTESKVVAIAENTREISVSSAQMKELAANEEFIWTCHVIESYLDRPMKPNETRLVSYLYGTLHFSKDLLLYLYEYCISLGKTNNNYIQTVALSWNEKGVATPEEAEKVSTAYHSAYNAVSKSLALGRALATVEKKYVDRWQNKWQMDLSVILEACNRTILKVHKADFKYIEGILERWQQNGVHTLQDVERADLAYEQNKNETRKTTNNQSQNRVKNQFQNFQQRDTSTQEVDDLERKLLMR